MRIGALSARVLSPSQPVTDPSANDSCLVLLVGRGGRGVLLGGDAEASATQRAVEGLDPGAVEVLKVGHHGSIGAVSESLLDDVDPTLAVISVGKGNGYGHPSADCLALLAGHGVQVRRTDFDGRVVLRF